MIDEHTWHACDPILREPLAIPPHSAFSLTASSLITLAAT
jgi:hypothetical protein